ncbi:MAG: DUF5131 family protein [Candidatus Glassbacteria bacterium]|nr:DUF5131 family protein [Candidatus Glassbacteria bacterium]
MRKRKHNAIGWCHETRNPITGCDKWCSYCYVARDDQPKMKFFWPKGYKPTEAEKEARRQEIMKPTFHPDQLAKMKKELATTEPSRVFVGSCADMFGNWIKPGADVSPVHVLQVLEVCAGLPQHRFLFLTKNPVGYAQYEFPENCWCGTSVTGERKTNDRIKVLMDSVPERRFVSIEPFVGGVLPVDAFHADWIIVGGLTGKNPQKPNDSLMWAVVELSKEWGKPVFIKDNAGNGPQQLPEGLGVD